MRKRFPEARFAFNWSSSFKWYRDPDPITFAQLGELGFKFIFITLGGQHAMGHGFTELLEPWRAPGAGLHRAPATRVGREAKDFPTRSHHEFSGVPYHHLIGEEYDSSRLGREFVEELPEDKVV